LFLLFNTAIDGLKKLIEIMPFCFPHCYQGKFSLILFKNYRSNSFLIIFNFVLIIIYWFKYSVQSYFWTRSDILRSRSVANLRSRSEKNGRLRSRSEKNGRLRSRSDPNNNALTLRSKFLKNFLLEDNVFQNWEMYHRSEKMCK